MDGRASDEQRERAAAEVREHYAAGRLDDDELSERLDAIYHARTEDELRALRKISRCCRRRSEPSWPSAAASCKARLIQHTGEALVPFLICTGIWVAAGASRGVLADLGGAVRAHPAGPQRLGLYGPAPS